MSRSTAGIFQAAGFMMVTTLISRLLGYARDIVIYSLNGQNSFTDAYNAAFSIPDFLYMLLVGGALSSALIPVLSSYIANEQEKEAWKVASIVLNLSLSLMLAGIALGLIFTPQLIHLLVPQLPAEAIALTIKLTRIMFIQTFFMALCGIAMGVLNSHQHFAAPAIGAALYNLVIIVVGWLLSPYLGIMGFSLGVVAGAVVNFLVQIPALMRVGFHYHLSFDLNHPGVKKVLLLMAPVLIGLSVVHFNIFVTQNLASRLPAGMLSALVTGQRLMQVPMGIFGTAIAIAIFPTLAQQAARQEMTEFKRNVSLGLRTVIFITLPTAVGLIALRVPIVQALFEQGNFDAADTLATSQALLFYSLGLFGYSAQQLLNRVFYSLHNTWTPVLSGVATIGLNIILSYSLVGRLGLEGLALAYSIAGVSNLLLLLWRLRPRIGNLGGRQLLISFAKTLGVSILTGLAASAVVFWLPAYLHFYPKINQLLVLLAGSLVGVAIFAAGSLLLKMEEAQMIRSLILGRLLPRQAG